MSILEKLYELKSRKWSDERNCYYSEWKNYNIYARLVDDVWIDKKCIYEKGTKVMIWMVSRYGDVGITGNLINPIGYNYRLDPNELIDYEFIKID